MQTGLQQPALSARGSAASGGQRLCGAHPLHRAAPRAGGAAHVHAELMKTSRWPDAFKLLTDKKVRGVSASEAAGLMRWPRSYVLVDVRRTDQFAAYHAAGSRSAPLYRLIDPKGASPMQLLRAIAFQAQNVDAVEDNPNAVAALRAAVAGASGLIFLDAEGGSLETTPQRRYGQVCRALLGAYTVLAQCGYTGTVLHLEGGLNAWFQAGLPGEGEEEAWAFSGRTPNSSAFARADKK